MMTVNPMEHDMEDAVMTRKIFMVLVVGLFIGAVPGIALADSYGMEEYDLSSARLSAESASTVDADVWPVSGPVETGAVPSISDSDKISPNDTHFNPFHPELRTIDGGGGGE
ncbi:MAG: hypothetical protein H6Q79_1141 [Deltaproteobacteria bacterium]|nr:hypothetical protein [Deltaproteobacteria bacterium]